MTLHVVDATRKYSIHTDYLGNTNLSYEEGFSSLAELRAYVNFSQSGRFASYTTPFGLQFSQNGYTTKMTLPLVFKNYVEGLCGDYDFSLTNDYQLRDGTVIPYNSGTGYTETSSEFQCSQNWLLTGDAGVDPNVVRGDLEKCTLKDECTTLFDSPWLAACTAKVDKTKYVQSCMVDYCETEDEDTKYAVLEEFIAQCQRHDPEDDAVCNWRNHLDIADCPAGEEWHGCQRGCITHWTCDYRECDVNPFTPRFTDGCFCPEATHIRDPDTGECVTTDTCTTTTTVTTPTAAPEWCASNPCLQDNAEPPKYDWKNYKKCTKKWAKKVKKGKGGPALTVENCPYRTCETEGITSFKKAKQCSKAVQKAIKKAKKKANKNKTPRML